MHSTLPRPHPPGSSPLGRGKRPPPAPLWPPEGLIPAWAGKTTSRLGSSSRSTAHPRVGGENRPVHIDCRVPGGSSPRGRGKPRRKCQNTLRGGLIPAWAGKTRNAPDRCDVDPAHPRVGGENPGWVGGPLRAVGSSPRGRGKQETTSTGQDIVRLIPAWAGKTPRSTAQGSRVPAHPRVGGENSVSRRTGVVGRGSSPRGRGKLGRWWRPWPSRGLIPAWAGKTLGSLTVGDGSRAHPRVGGENLGGSAARPEDDGSSPRGRGKQCVYRSHMVSFRLIPAWAGKTVPLPPSPTGWRAHPRVGGENFLIVEVAEKLDGSSPRGRGKPRRADRPRSR